MLKRRFRTPMQRKCLIRFLGRVTAAVITAVLYIADPACFAVLEGMAFFHGVSFLHLLWCVWMADMLFKLVPARGHMALGAQKQFAAFYDPAGQPPDREELRAFTRDRNRGAVKVLLLWLAVFLALGALRWAGVLGAAELFLCTVLLYACDLVFVLFWCPLRALLMKNRCCTTCRIFNWDHLMIFSPLIVVPGFYTLSLAGAAALVLLVWEVLYHRHPERFWERTNQALRCAQCTDRFCLSQLRRVPERYCRKRSRSTAGAECSSRDVPYSSKRAEM